MPQRRNPWTALALVAIGVAVAGCGRDDPGAKPPTHANGAAAPATAPAAGPGTADADAALRSPDPAVAGPAAFAAMRAFGESGDVSLLLRLVPAARAKLMRDELEQELERFRKEPDRAKAAQERMALPKSPAEMDLAEFTREVAASMKRSGFARAQVDQEAGATYLSAAIERPEDGGERRLVVRGQGADADGTPVVRETVFVWSDGRWALDMDASHDRGMGLVRRLPLSGPSPNRFVFAGEAVLVSSEGVRRLPLDPAATPASAPDTAWVGAVHVTGPHVLYQVEGAWRHATLPTLAPSAVALPEGVQLAAVSPSGPEAYLVTGTAVLRMNLDDGATTTAFALPEDGGLLAIHALPGDRVLVRPRNGAALEARALADGSRAYAIPLRDAPDHLEVEVAIGGDVVAVADGQVVNLYAASDGTFLRKLSADGRVETLSLSPDGRLLALDTSRVHVHRVADGAVLRVLSASPGSVTPPLAWDASGHRLAAWLREGTTNAAERPSVGVYRFD